jgi:hypothetical protein
MPHLKRCNRAIPVCGSALYVSDWQTLPSSKRCICTHILVTVSMWKSRPFQCAGVGGEGNDWRRETNPRTHAPAGSFSIARSTAAAGWYTPTPRNVSMTCPFRKKAEKTLHWRDWGIGMPSMIMSEAPSADWMKGGIVGEGVTTDKVLHRA